jgi:hypothetical protein
VAELRERGEHGAFCFHTWQLGAEDWNSRHPYLYHTRVRRENGRTEDPSWILGMPQ